MTPLHPDYLKSKRRLDDFIFKHGGASPALSIYIGNRWDEALAKDPSGGQCVLLVEDFIEQLTAMKT